MTLAWITVPEGSGTDDCTARVARDVPPAGDRLGGLSDPELVASAGSTTIPEPASGCPMSGIGSGGVTASATTSEYPAGAARLAASVPSVLVRSAATRVQAWRAEL